MKSVLMIGAGKFGTLLCRNLMKLGNEVMIVDEDEEKLTELLDCATSVKIANCTRKEVLASFGPADFDVCIVCIPGDFQSSLEITNQLHEMGARRVISLASTEIQAKFLHRNGADEIIYPERDIAERSAMAISHDSVFDFIKLSEEYAIFEMTPPEQWIGRSIKAVNVRARYQLSILGNRKDGKIEMPGPDYVFKKEEHLIVMGHIDTIHGLVERT